MTVHRDYAEKAAEVSVLVAPWLPDAVVTEFSVSESCGCYSEYTTEPPCLYITLRAPRPDGDSDKGLGMIVSIIEKQLKPWAEGTFTFSGCECCGYEDGSCSLTVRVIRRKVDAQ